MKVRITKVTSDACWYDSLIGKEYEVNSEMNDRYLVRNKRFGILKSDCEIVEDTMEKKQYVVVKPIMDVPAEEISINIFHGTGDTQFYPDSKSLYISDEGIIKWTGKGIIREKKSKAEEITERIIDRIGDTQSTIGWSEKKIAYKEIILSELEKAGVK